MNIVTDEINSRSYIKDSKTWLKEFNTVAEMHKVEEGYKTAGFSASAYKWLKPQINKFMGARTFRDYATASRMAESSKALKKSREEMAGILKKHNIKVPKKLVDVEKEFGKRLDASNVLTEFNTAATHALPKRTRKNFDHWNKIRNKRENAAFSTKSF